jgi:outer membrane protein TolC
MDADERRATVSWWPFVSRDRLARAEARCAELKAKLSAVERQRDDALARIDALVESHLFAPRRGRGGSI